MNRLLQEIQLPAYTFTEFPEELNHRQYEQVINQVLAQTSKFAGVMAIYTRECDLWPGRNRCDVYYVLNDIADEGGLKKGLLPTFHRLTEKTDSFEKVMFLSSSLFQYYDQIKLHPNLKYRHGQEVRFATLSTEYRDFCHLLALNDLIVMSPLPALANTLLSGEIPVKTSWTYLQSAVEIIENYAKIRRQVPTDWVTFCQECRELAKQWYQLNLNRFQLIKHLLRKALSIQLALIDDLQKYLQKDNKYFIQQQPQTATDHSGISVPEEYRAAFINDRYKVLFLDSWSPDIAFQKMTTLYKKRQEYCLYLPALLSVPYVMYYRGTNEFSEFIQHCFLYHGYSANATLPEAVNMRHTRLAEYLAFYRDKNYLMDQQEGWLGYSIEAPNVVEKFISRFKYFEKKAQEKHIRKLHSLSLDLARI